RNRYTKTGIVLFSSRSRNTMSLRDWSSDVCASDLAALPQVDYPTIHHVGARARIEGDGLDGRVVDLRERGDGELPIRDRTRQHRSEERRVGIECWSRWVAGSVRESDT